jgi:[protein-PII] uridylyltransferase
MAGSTTADGELKERAKSQRQVLMDGAESRLDANTGGRTLVKYLSAAVDDLLLEWWRELAGDASNVVDIVAVGGYGRAELCPQSDWDLLFLVPDGKNPQINHLIQRFAQLLWDSGAHLGHAVRTPEEARNFALDDHHTRTALLESRLLSGSGVLYQKLQKTVAPQKWSKRQRIEFCREKLDECANRRAANGGTAFVMEPDCKNGKGGLRDVSTMFWLSMAWYGVPSARELIGKGVVEEAEFNGFVRGRDFLWRVRSALHLAARRENDRLRFEYQPELAARFRYRDTVKSSAVERFLKNYFLNVRRIADLTDIFLLHFEEQIKPAPRLVRRVKIGGGMEVRREVLNIYDVEAFAADPLNVVRIFSEAQKSHRYLNSRALRIVRKHAALVTSGVRASKEANAIFLDILRSPRNVTTALSQMHETGVLGRFCPDFGHITGHGQFDRYHQYTVDAHTIRAIDILRDFRLGEGQFIDMPLASKLMPKLRRPELLYLALLYHDIAKGRGGDHSELGEELAVKFCRRLGLSGDDVELVAWLVRHHLQLSKAAQHHDLSDPDVIAEFSGFVGDPERLKYLFLLTVADVTAVGPGTWTDWKGHLFTQLYYAADACLRNGQVAPADQDKRIESRRNSVRKSCEPHEKVQVNAALAVISKALTLHFPPKPLFELCRMLGQESGAELNVEAGQGYTRVLVWGRDRPKLFSQLTATLAHANTKVMTVHAFTLRDGRMLDEFHVVDANDAPVREAGQLERLRKRLKKVLGGEEPAAITRPTDPDITMKHQSVEVRRHLAAAHHVTAIEVVAADRKGLLASLAAAIAETGVELRGANISTFGARAVDVFFVTDELGDKLDDPRTSALIDALHHAANLSPEAEAVA